MPKLKSVIILPTPEEDQAITQAAMADPDAIPFSDEEWEKVTPWVGQRPTTEPPIDGVVEDAADPASQ